MDQSVISPLQRERYTYLPSLPERLQGEIGKIALHLGETTEPSFDHEHLRRCFPKSYGKPIASFSKKGSSSSLRYPTSIGVVLSGGQAPGGHNVIAGLYDGLKKACPNSRLYGFLGGPSGLLSGESLLLSQEVVDRYRNTGGFDIIGSGRTKLESRDDFQRALEVCTERGIEGLVIIGGDDSNTNGALLAEYFLEKGSKIAVVGCPKTIDGDLKTTHVEASFGFDTATKTYAELIGNIARDAASAQKYWHFIKVMGRSASHIALECALTTHPNITIISEEVRAKKQTLSQIIEQIVSAVKRRSERGKNYGVVLIPEGLVEFIPEMGSLIGELNDLLAEHEEKASSLSSLKERVLWLQNILSTESRELLLSLPLRIQEQLLMNRDPHGNVQVSRIETDTLLAEMTEKRLAQEEEKGTYRGSFSSFTHFFGYEGRCAFPSNFDADYCYTLGYTAFLLLSHKLTGYIVNVRGLHLPVTAWQPGGIPLSMLMHMERRGGEEKPVIRKALVDLVGAPFRHFSTHREIWAEEDAYLFPGAIQYYGPDTIANRPTETLLQEGRARLAAP